MGVSEEQRRQNAQWIAPTSDERLTLVSCWPYWSNSHRVIVIAKPYTPLAATSDVIPELSLFGAISVGTAMVVLTVAPLVGVSLALLAFSLVQRNTCYRESTLLGGSALVTLGTNFCCCCAPAVYPLLAVVLGTTTASSLAVWMVGSSSPFYNLTQVATLVLILLGLPWFRCGYSPSRTAPS